MAGIRSEIIGTASARVAGVSYERHLGDASSPQTQAAVSRRAQPSYRERMLVINGEAPPDRNVPRGYYLDILA